MIRIYSTRVRDYLIHSDLHHHSMLTLSLSDFEPIYGAIRKYLSKGYAVVYSSQQTATIPQILRQMTQSGILPDVEDDIQSGMLTIVDEKTITARKNQLNATELADLLFSSALNARKKSGAKKVVVMCNTSVLLKKGDEERHAKQIEFEQAINNRFNENDKYREQIQIICCYDSALMQNVSLKHIIPMVNAHNAIIDKNWNYNRLQPSIVKDIITRGMEASLDLPTTRLILKTFKLIYKIDENSIISNPALFEETLRKVIGSNAGDAVLASIVEQAINQMLQQQ